MVKRHLPSVHAYADDTQLYLAFKPDWVELCVREIRAWMLCDKLEINDGKTEVIIIGAQQQLAQVHIDCLTVHVDARVPFVSAVKSDLGTWIDTSLQVNIIIHVKAPITTLKMSGV